MTKVFPLRTILATTLPALLFTPHLWAQDVDATAMEEVVVYARKTNENKQTVPISMVVNTGRDLENAQIVNFKDITKVTPGLTIVSDDPTSSSIKIRGVGLAFFGLAADPGVVITVDEFPQSRIGSVFGAFLDVQQVEVLKGPQGTLYGRNAPNGVISIRSNKPDYDGVHGRFDVSASTYNTYVGETAVNLPLVDDMLSLRLAYIHSESEGFNNLAQYETVNTAESDYTYVYADESINADETDGDSARATILFEPVDTLTFTGRLNRTEYNNGQISLVADGPLIYREGTMVVDPAGNIVSADKEDNLSFQDNLDYSDYTLKEGGLKIEWSPEAGRLVSLSQLQKFDTELSETIDAKPSPIAVPRVLTSGDELFSQELRWHSNIGDSLHYLVGLFYAKQDITITYEQLETITGQLIVVSGEQENKSYAFFANADYALNDQWTISLGGRYNDEEENIDANLDLSALFGVGGDVNIGQIQDGTTDDNTSFSFKTRYQYDDDILFYFAWDTAYKSGGFNAQIANTAAFFVGNDNIATLERDFLQYPAEESEAFELGMKSLWLDSTVLFNIALFYQDFENFQNLAGVPSDRLGGFSLGVLINPADKVNTQGIEVEASWLISDEWNVSFSSSFANAVADKWDTNYCDDDDNTADPLQLYCPLGDGDRLNDDHLWNSNLQLDYRTPLPGTDMVFFSHISYSLKAESGGDNDNSRPTVDLNIGIDVNNWSLKVWSKNLLDDKDYNGRTTQSDVEGVDNFFLGRNIEPRTLGITAIYSFGEE